MVFLYDYLIGRLLIYIYIFFNIIFYACGLKDALGQYVCVAIILIK
jgi:hypothetical protein